MTSPVRRNKSRCTSPFIAGAAVLLFAVLGSAAAQTIPPAPPTAAPSAIPGAASNVPQQGPAQSLQQRGIIIVGGAPANPQQPLQWQNAQQPWQVRGPQSQATATQTPSLVTSPSTLPSATSTVGSISTNRLGGRSAASAARTGSKAAPSKQAKLLSLHAQIVSDEARLLDAQNAVARSIRIYNTGPMPPVHSATLLDSRANAPPRLLPRAKWQPILARREEPSTARDFARSASVGGQSVASGTDLLRPAPSPAQFMPAQSARRFSASAGLKRAGIFFVNNETDGFSLTPNGYVTIQGFGFGATPGQVSLHGVHLDGSAFSGAFKVVDWHDNEILAMLPRYVDLGDQIAILQVVTHLGTTYSMGGARFHAARDEYELDSGLGGFLQISNNSNWNIGGLQDDGSVERFDTGSSIDCKAPGTDYLYVTVPAPARQQGYVLSGISAVFARSDAGDGDVEGHAGDRVFTPGYSLGDWTRGSPVGPVRVVQAAMRGQSTQTDMIPLSWGVWRSHSGAKPPLELLSEAPDALQNLFFNTLGRVVSTDGPGIREIGPDICLSGYRLTVYVIGPAVESAGVETGTPQ